MNKGKIIIKLISIFALLVIVSICPIYADSEPVLNEPISSWVGDTGEQSIGKVDEISGRAWMTIKTVVQVAAFIGIIITGIRYMFASADAKADMKRSMGILIIGLVLVFGASVVVDIIYKITTETL